MKAYGAAAYVRVKIDGRWSAKLLCSRSKVAPIKTMTIPRLELCAMDLGRKLLTKVKEIDMFRDSPAFMWTDSEIVLHWLRKSGTESKVFVANRVKKILNVIKIEQARHVRSEHNPADLLSRGTHVSTLHTTRQHTVVERSGDVAAANRIMAAVAAKSGYSHDGNREQRD